MCHGVPGFVLQHALQGVDGGARFATVNLNLAFADQRIGVIRRGFEDLVIQPSGFVDLIFQDEELNASWTA